MDPDVMLLVRYIYIYYIYIPLNPIESYEIPVSIHFPHGSSLAPACTTASDILSFSPDWKMTTAEWTWMHLAWSSTVRAGVLGRRSRRGRSLDIVLYISWIFIDIGAAYTKIAILKGQKMMNWYELCNIRSTYSNFRLYKWDGDESKHRVDEFIRK